MGDEKREEKAFGNIWCTHEENLEKRGFAHNAGCAPQNKVVCSFRNSACSAVQKLSSTPLRSVYFLFVSFCLFSIMSVATLQRS